MTHPSGAGARDAAPVLSPGPELCRSYDPFSSSRLLDPYPIYRALREHAPVHHVASADVWVLSRFEDIQRASRDWRSFSSIGGVDLDDSGEIFGPGFFIDTDPPDHTRMRDAIRRQFNPAELVRRLEHLVRDAVDELLDSVLREGGADFVAGFAQPLPVTVLSTLLGLPRSDRDHLARLFRQMEVREPGNDRAPQVARDAAIELHHYFEAFLAEHSPQGSDDLLTHILAARDAGVLTSREVLGMCFFLCVAGTETTDSMLGNSVLLLADRPEQRGLLAAGEVDPAHAVEELLRFESPIQYLARTPTTDVELHGARIPAGARVLLLYGAANRDERRWEDPETLDLRRPLQRNLAFGEGIHHCLGAPVARLEARVALPRVFARLGDYEVAGPVERMTGHTIRGLVSLPIAVR